jgi:hypothetical protein
MLSRVEQFIQERCGESVRLEDLRPFLDEEVFFNATPEDPAASGIPGTALTLPLSLSPVGPVVVFFANATDARLLRPFAGVRLGEALEIALATEGAAGVAIQSGGADALIIECESLVGLPHRAA